MDLVKRMHSRWFGGKRKQNPFISDYAPSWEVTILRQGDDRHPTVKLHRERVYRERHLHRAA